MHVPDRGAVAIDHILFTLIWQADLAADYSLALPLQLSTSELIMFCTPATWRSSEPSCRQLFPALTLALCRGPAHGSIEIASVGEPQLLYVFHRRQAAPLASGMLQQRSRLRPTDCCHWTCKLHTTGVLRLATNQQPGRDTQGRGHSNTICESRSSRGRE